MGEGAVLAAIEKMTEPARSIGRRLHAVIRANAPDLTPRTWYGFPAYARGAAVLFFFRSGDRFGERYMTLGFNDSSHLDDGHMWPIYYAFTELDDADLARIGELVKRAIR